MNYFTQASQKEYVAQLTAHRAVIDSLIAAVKADDLHLVNHLVYDPYNQAEKQGVARLRHYCRTMKI